MLLLLVVLLLPSMMLATMMLLLLLPAVVSRIPAVLGRSRLAALEVDVDAAGVILGVVAHPEFPTELFDLGLELHNQNTRQQPSTYKTLSRTHTHPPPLLPHLLRMVTAMVPLSHNGMQVRLPRGLVCADPRLEDPLGLVDELAVQVDGVGFHLSGSIVCAKDEIGRLPVVVVHLGRVRLALIGELLCASAVARVVRLAGLDLLATHCQVRINGKVNIRTRSKHWLRFEASERAMSRRRSYSRSTSSSSPLCKAAEGSEVSCLESHCSGPIPPPKSGHNVPRPPRRCIGMAMMNKMAFFGGCA